MAVQTNDIKIYKSTIVSDTSSNGGVIGSTLVTSTKHSLFPPVTSAELISGLTRYRKIFFRNENTEDFPANDFKSLISTLSTSGDYYRIKAGTNTDTQGTASGYASWAGAGTLATNANASDSSIVVDYDTSNGVYAGSVIQISDGVNSEVHTVLSVVWDVNEATITLDGTTLANSYLVATPTVISTIIDLGSLQTSTGSWSETSASGTYNEITYPITTYNKGTVTDTWTVTFSSATVFSVSGASVGSVGTGNIAIDFKPINGLSWYFLLESAGFGGTWASGDTITFTTTHASKSLWLKEVIPAGTSAYTGNTMKLGYNFVSG